MELPERLPLVLDGPLEVLDALARVLLQPVLESTPLAESLLEARDNFGMLLVGLPPPIHYSRALLRELCEALLDRVRVVLHLPPLLQREAETIYLRLEIGQANIDVGGVPSHRLAHYRTFLFAGVFLTGAFLPAGVRAFVVDGAFAPTPAGEAPEASARPAA